MAKTVILTEEYIDLVEILVNDLRKRCGDVDTIRYLIYLGFTEKDIIALGFDESEVKAHQKYMDTLTDFESACPDFS